ncbi:hypothetical protein P7D22_21925 [Lichenihabitans sp. Uapishka_5]|uniref:hypothetical protein n=1 Tax=Lichenihabitans sp. Uapishka_5 TaxID=3037302 RepID=UPI0029E80BEC|nr:hypothetical protein [Lichenihabitans sp. Uapishka_5]MDX7953825.1 hypothetical protein [Lichenihabitans sp. Uapishka_5]
MPKPNFLRVVLKREREQGAHLERALLGHYQREFRAPEAELRRLGRRDARRLGCFNLYARRWWLRALLRHLPRGVLAQGRLSASQPVFLLTLLDRNQVWRPERDDGHSITAGPSLADIRQAYARHLQGLDAVGMIETALYVSAQRVLGSNRVMHFHLHALVWNVDEEALQARCAAVNDEIRPVFGYATAADARLIEQGDLMQVAWYLAKAPRKQYQVHRKDNDRVKQFKRAINGVNAVRLYAELGRYTLDQLTLASGGGRDVLRGMLTDLQRWRNTSLRPRSD